MSEIEKAKLDAVAGDLGLNDQNAVRFLVKREYDRIFETQLRKAKVKR